MVNGRSNGLVGIALVFVALLVVTGAPGVTQAARRTNASKGKLRRAKRVLAQVKLVDGAGSGLDADTVQGLKPLMVVDANGKFVGALLELPGNGGAFVIRRLGDVSVRLGADFNGFNNFSDNRFFYESSDCSGPPLMLPNQGRDRFFPPTAIVSGNSAYYVTEGSTHSIASDALIGTQADCNSSGTVFVPPDLCCYGGWTPQPFIVGDAVSFDLTTLGLVTPFHLDIPTDTSATATTTTVPQTP